MSLVDVVAKKFHTPYDHEPALRRLSSLFVFPTRKAQRTVPLQSEVILDLCLTSGRSNHRAVTTTLQRNTLNYTNDIIAPSLSAN